MKKNKIILSIVLLFVITFVNADLGSFEQGQNISLKANLNATSVNITVYYPNSSIAVDNQPMTQLKGNIFNYVFSHTNNLGDYIYDYCDQNGKNCKENTFKVTPSGKNFEVGEVLGAVGSLAVSLVLAFFFMILGNRISEKDNLLPIGFLFVGASMALALFSLLQTFTFSIDIAQYQALGDTTEIMFITILWIVVGIVIISMALMLIAFIKELKNVVEKKKFGEDWNPITKTYDM